MPGKPGFNSNGTECGKLAKDESAAGCGEDAYSYQAKAEADPLTFGKLTPAGASQPWKVIHSANVFTQLASGALRYEGPPLGSPNVAPNGTLHQGRQAAIVGKDAATPSGDAYIRTVPTLKTMAEGAIQHLSKNANGFFVRIEGGVTDWSHTYQ